MARALQTFVLAQEGILDPRFSSIEEYVGKNSADQAADNVAAGRICSSRRAIGDHSSRSASMRYLRHSRCHRYEGSGRNVFRNVGGDGLNASLVCQRDSRHKKAPPGGGALVSSSLRTTRWFAVSSVRGAH
jgi:hypothetical protein